MSLLQRCTALWGGADILDEDPETIVVRDGFYMPFRPGEAWGLFDQDGRIVPAATDYREERAPSHPQVLDPGLSAQDVRASATEGTFIYAGYVNVHFGHYLINSLPRLWSIARLRTPSTKILCHAGSSPAELFSVPFIGTILASLGLAPRDFVVFRQPVRLSCVVVPGTALREQSAGHRVYSQFCRAIAERIAPGHGRDRSDRAVYYSKARLSGAVGVIENEAEIEEVMREANIDVVHPERLTLADQIRLMSGRDRLIGTSGSFFHTSIFCPPRRITCLNYTEKINSNYTIIDGLAGNDASYHYPPALRLTQGRPGVLTARHLPNARAAARELIERARSQG